MDNSGPGPAVYTLDFVQPPGHVIETLEYAMINRLPLSIGSGFLPTPWRLLVVVGMNIHNEALDVTTLGGFPSYVPSGRRTMQIRAIEYVPGT